MRATIILIVTSMWEMFTQTGCPEDHAASDFEAFTNIIDPDDHPRGRIRCRRDFARSSATIIAE